MTNPEEKLREEFEKWRDTQGGWPSRTECGEWFIQKFKEHTEAIIKIGEGKLIQSFNIGRTAGGDKCVGCAFNWRDCQCKGINEGVSVFITAIKQASNI